MSIDLFTKDTDSNQWLHATSCHPSYRKKSIIYGQAIRFKRIFSVSNKLKRKIKQSCNWLVNQGYTQETVMPEIHRVDAIECESLLVKYPM